MISACMTVFVRELRTAVREWACCYNEVQGSKIVLVRSYLRVPQAAGQVNILIFLVKIEYSPLYAN